MTLAPGTTLSHYRLVEKIGEGGRGVVWHATDETRRFTGFTRTRASASSRWSSRKGRTWLRVVQNWLEEFRTQRGGGSK